MRTLVVDFIDKATDEVLEQREVKVDDDWGFVPAIQDFCNDTGHDPADIDIEWDFPENIY